MSTFTYAPSLTDAPEHSIYDETQQGKRIAVAFGSRDIARLLASAPDLRDELKRLTAPVPRSEYHDDDGPVLWWRFPIVEPPYCGRPDDSDWPESDDYTHWTPIPIPESPGSAGDKS